MKKIKIRKILAFMLALALMVSCMPSAYTISASEAFGDGTEDIFTDGESASVPAAEEETTDVGSADQEEPAQQTTLTYEDDSVKVTAEALEESALPQNTTLKADAVNENSSVSYDTVSQKLAKAAEDKGSSLRGFSAYDVYFADADGNRAELNGRAKITIEYKNPSAPELTDVADTSVTAVKLHYNGSNGETEVGILQPDEELKVLNVSESKQLQTLQVETSNTAVWAVMWDSPEVEATASNEEEIATEAETVGETEISETENTETPEENAEVTEAPEEDAEVTEAPEEDAEVTEVPEEDAEVIEVPEEDAEVTEAPEEDAEVTETPSADAESKITILEVIADNTNLRISPSTEAEIVTTVAAGTQLTALETVTAEDGTTWYKVSFNETEGYVRSDLVKVVENADDSEEEDSLTDELQQEDTVTYTKEVDNVVITATAAQGVLPEDAELVVNAIEKDNSQYSEVAEKLEEKAKAEEYSIAGFLAYDIFFTDKDGNKIEPQDGKVKVSMAYTKAAIPEEVANQADNAGTVNESDEAQVSDGTDSDSAVENGNVTQQYEVSLMHLSEDDNGQVKEVVDMTGAGQGNVETTADSEVTRAEFETESFSAFTIIWKVGNTNYTLSVHRMLEKADGTLEEDSSTTSYAEGDLSNANNVTLSKLGDSYGINGYIYSYGYVVNTSGEKKNATKISYNNYGQGQSGENWWYGWYAEDLSEKWAVYATGKTSDVYLVYKPTYLNTVDSKKDGITVNLFDYNDTKVNSGHALQFVRASGDGINAWTGGAKPNQGIMKNLLGKDADGNYTYPVLSSNSEGTSYLFSPTDTTAKTNYTDLNKLFTKDADGYYEYNSANNYAYLDGSEFKVYSIPGTTTEAQGTSGGKNVGGFFPFNPLPSGSEEIISGIRNIETGTNKATRVDHFGMTMSAEFIQPEDGEVNGKDMEFKFSGDDDVWVYIDGVLVLDIGGIHDAVSGTINFKTGAVTVDSKNDTTLKALFEAAGVSTDNFNGNTFADYTGHTINFYYLERGSYASNCHLKFNLSTIPESSIAVEKQLDNTDKEKYTNVEFKFQVLAQEILSTDSSGNETYGNTYVPLGGDNVVLNDENSTKVTFSNETIDGKEYANVFTLKPGQRAIFKGLKKTRKYMVKEIDVKTTEYDKVYINRTEITVTDKNGKPISSETKVGNIVSDKATVGNRPLVIFTNNCSEANKRELQITKKIKNDIAVTDKFDFKVKLNDLAYTGEYYLKDSDGNYYTQNKDGTLNSKGETSTVCGTASEDGIISRVPAGYTVAITQILSGTKFEVEEVNLSADDYRSPQYKVEYKEGNNSEEKTVDENATNVEGTIELNKNVEITVTNIPANSGELVIHKVDMNGDALPGAEFTLTSTTDENVKYTKESDAKGEVKFDGLSTGTYHLKETAAPNGYYLRNNTWTVEVDSKGNTKLLTSTGKPVKDNKIVNYTKEQAISADKKAEVDDWDKRTYNVTITASSKVSESEESDPVDVVLVFDASGSMQFRSSLEKYNGGVATTYGSLERSKVYYTIDDNKAATVRRVWYQNGNWYSCDDSYWDYSTGKLNGASSKKNSNDKAIFYITNNPNSRLYYLKDAAKQFASNLAGLSAESKIALVTFTKAQNNGGVVYNFAMNTVGENLSNFNSAVDNITTQGGTQPSLGINKAKEILNTNEIKNDGRDKYVILLTDGCPADDTHDNVKSTAEQLKADTGCTLITVGVGLSLVNDQNLEDARKTLYTIASEINGNGTKLAYNVDDASQLQSYFKQILQTIENKVTIGNVDVKDYIDPRFELVESSVSGSNYSIGADENGTYVIWKNQNVGPEVGNEPGWKQTITVRAKDEYIGGNNVTTNGYGSNVGGVILPQPTVNVKSDLIVNNAETTIFYGEKVPTDGEILKRLFDSNNPEGYVTELDGSKKKVKYTTAPDGSGLNPEDFTLTWYKDSNCTETVTREEMGTETPDPATKEYYLKVTYNKLGTVGSNDSCTINSGGNISGTNGVVTAYNSEDAGKESKREYGVYKINIIPGVISITKEIKNVTSDQIRADKPEFTFEVVKTDETPNQKIGEYTLKFDGSEENFKKQVQAVNDELSKLKKGIYTVKEISVPEGYSHEETENGETTNVAYNISEKVMTFAIGMTSLEDTKTDLTKTTGDVIFTNAKKAVSEWQIIKTNKKDDSPVGGAEFELKSTETTGKTYVGTSNSNGVITWKDGDQTIDNSKGLEKGTYILTETKAPNGFVLSTETWQITIAYKGAMPEIKSGETTVDLVEADNENIYKCKFINTEIYKLPSAGGPGIYGFTISGVAILATALLLFINNKRREEEAEKS